ncbi:type II toxin-antitoxin system prevent-host-death family antitoxin [Kamptonema cortianum]|nr:type II toxin-antitoxin system prevent-host-death family antitoxin [Kamptonema cortianum]
MQQYSIEQVQNNLKEIVHAVEQGTPVEIVQSGKRVAVLLSPNQYDRLNYSTSGFWESLQAFRQQVNLAELNLDEIFEGVRDVSPGREVNL